MPRKHSNLFQDSYDGWKGYEAHIRMKTDATPVFHKPRRVPYALREPVEAELQTLEKNGVIVKMDRSRWASPIVVVRKTDKSVRICGDYKVSINPFVEDEQITLSTTQDLYVQLSGSKVFSKLDLSHAYAQLKVDEESREFLTINTHKGLYSFLKLACGVKSAPKIFQMKMDQILPGIPKCVCKQDDILIGAETVKEHLDIVEMILERLSEYNVHLKLPKCKFLQSSTVHLGFEYSTDGLRPVEDSVEDIKKASHPTNVSQFRSWLGMIQYYHQFLPDLATVLTPMHHLLKKGVAWEWTSECQGAFEACKQSLTSENILVHYNPKQKLKLTCDASSYGLGAELSHEFENGDEKAICYASRTMSSSG